jgi:hypothetical protein
MRVEMEKLDIVITKEEPPVDLAQRMLELPQAWSNLKDGKITPQQFEATLAGLSVVYDAVADKQKEPSEDLLWKQYELETGLYKHYLELILKFNTFYYAVTGAIVSFYFTKADVPLAKYALLFPILMGIVFGVVFVFAVIALQISRETVFNIRDKLNLEAAPEINVLGALLAMSALLQFVVAGALLWFFFPALIVYAVVFALVIGFLLWLMFR